MTYLLLRPTIIWTSFTTISVIPIISSLKAIAYMEPAPKTTPFIRVRPFSGSTPSTVLKNTHIFHSCFRLPITLCNYPTYWTDSEELIIMLSSLESVLRAPTLRHCRRCGRLSFPIVSLSLWAILHQNPGQSVSSCCRQILLFTS
jgi:hypothetical protein